MHPLKKISTVWHELFAGVYFCGLVTFLCFAGNNFRDWDRLFFLAGNNFLRFSESTQYPALIIFSLIVKYVQYGVRTLCKTSVSLHTIS